MRTAEDSEQVLRQPELSRAMVGTTAHQKVYRPEGKRLEPEKDSQRTGAQDTQLIDLTTEEPALLEELGSGKPTRKTGPSAITSMGMGRAERKFPGQVNWQAGDEEKEVPLRACTTKAGEGRDSVLQRQPDQRADTEESDVSDIPEWILADNLQLNRSITPPEGQFIRDQGERNDGDCGPAAVIGAVFYLGSRADSKLRQTLMERLSYEVAREFAAHHLQYQSLLSVAKMGAGNTLLESEVKAATRDMCEQVPTWPKEGNPCDISLC